MGMAPIGLAQVMGRSVSDGDREGGIFWLARECQVISCFILQIKYRSRISSLLVGTECVHLSHSFLPSDLNNPNMQI